MQGGRGSIGDASIYLQRQAILNDLRGRYARFGDKLVNFLHEHAFQRGGVRRVLSKVLRPLPLDPERMHEALNRFLNTEGVEAFFARVELKDTLTPSGIRPAQGRPLTGYEENLDQAYELLDRRTGIERRSSKERRSIIQMIFKNRRFGRDRRAGLERRCGTDRRLLTS